MARVDLVSPCVRKRWGAVYDTLVKNGATEIFVFGSVLEHYSLNLAVVGLEAANQSFKITRELEELTNSEVILLDLATLHPRSTSFILRFG